ncbi:MAG: cell division protein FtsZ [Pseudomonadota bacterium]
MALNLTTPESEELRPRITVFGVGGAGGNAVNNMIEKNLEGAEFVVANTDAQALQQSSATSKLQLGASVTQGLGAGAKPDVGASAAEESLDQITEQLSGSHMCFITAGMGGGTGTGAAPVIARQAREMGILTVGVVTKPFQFEGGNRMKLAEGGIDALQQVVDTLIIIPNQNLFRIANERTTFAEAFMLADDVLYQGVKGVTDLMVRPGLINLDFADVRAVMDEMGKAMMGTGEAEGETRAIDAAEKAIANPLLDEVSLKGAKGVLINITGGYDLTLFELDEAANRIRSEVDPEANIIVGSTLDPEIDGMMRVSVVATGIDATDVEMSVPRPSERRPIETNPIVTPKPAAPAPEVAPAARRPEAAPAARTPDPEPAPEPKPEPAPAPAAAETAPEPQPKPRRLIIDDEEPNLFADYDPHKEPEASAPDAPESFIAPQPSRPHEMIVDDAVADVPMPGEREVVAQPSVAAPSPSPRLAVAAQNEPDEEKGRFGLNSLIHRMTGGAAKREPAPLASGAQRAEEVDEAEDDGREHDEDLRMEIPAFLRRQAN